VRGMGPLMVEEKDKDPILALRNNQQDSRTARTQILPTANQRRRDNQNTGTADGQSDLDWALLRVKRGCAEDFTRARSGPVVWKSTGE